MIKSTTEKINSILNRNPVLSVLILSGLVGFGLGLSNSSWQTAVETGQVLAGIVKYPIDNPNYMYHIKVFSIVNQLCALLLRLIGSEKVVSIVISGLLGAISFQALGMVIFAINRNIYISILGAIFIFFANYIGVGMKYPIWLLGRANTYGILGLSFIVLVIALIGAKAYRLGLFCLGLAPSVHASWGSWLFLIIFFSALFQPDFTKKIIRTYYWYFIAGIFIAVLSLIYQLYLMRVLPVIDPGIKKQYLDSFVKYWDVHRIPFYRDHLTQQFSFTQRGVAFCIQSIIVGLLSLIYFKKERSLSFIFKVVIISGILSLSIASITHLPPESVPAYLLILMPGRYNNFNNVILAAALLGILTHGNNKHYKSNYYIFLLFLIAAFFPQNFSRDFRILLSIPLILLYLTYLDIKKYYATKVASPGPVNHSCAIFKYAHTFIKKEDSFLTLKGRFNYSKTLLFITVIFLLINLPGKISVKDSVIIPRLFYLKDRTNDAFYSKISERKGMMVITSDFSLISLITRRPVLVNVTELDGFMVVPESGPVLDNILRKIYGVSIMNAPPRVYRNKGKIPSELYRDLWEKRTVGQWQDIRKEFGARDVLTKADWELSLPIVFKDDRMVLYEIPANAHSVNYSNYPNT